MRRITPDMAREVAQGITWEESGDLIARLLLINLAEQAFDSHHKTQAASLMHAAVYLENRAEYIADPWPKNAIRIPTEDK